MGYYSTDRIRSYAYRWPRRPIAEVLPGTFQGRFVAITILVRGSRWVCHPNADGPDSWRSVMHGLTRMDDNNRHPPRWVRKAAKLALRRWLNP